MVDCQLYGLKPGGHHLTNLLFHLANTVLLLDWLRRLPGNGGRAFVAALLCLASPACGISGLGGGAQGCVEHLSSGSRRCGRIGIMSNSELAAVRVGPAQLCPRPHGQADARHPALVLLLVDYWPLRRVQLFPLQPFSPTFLCCGRNCPCSP